jgi:hypothetical protein
MCQDMLQKSLIGISYTLLSSYLYKLEDFKSSFPLSVQRLAHYT